MPLSSTVTPLSRGNRVYLSLHDGALRRPRHERAARARVLQRMRASTSPLFRLVSRVPAELTHLLEGPPPPRAPQPAGPSPAPDLQQPTPLPRRRPPSLGTLPSLPWPGPAGPARRPRASPLGDGPVHGAREEPRSPRRVLCAPARPRAPRPRPTQGHPRPPRPTAPHSSIRPRHMRGPGGDRLRASRRGGVGMHETKRRAPRPPLRVVRSEGCVLQTNKRLHGLLDTQARQPPQLRQLWNARMKLRARASSVPVPAPLLAQQTLRILAAATPAQTPIGCHLGGTVLHN